MEPPSYPLDIPIFHKIYELYKLLTLIHGNIPKLYRHTLWQRCELININLLELLFQATRKKEKLSLLYQISHQLDLLKILIRLAKDVKAIPPKKYMKIEGLLQESGKMLGGWIKSVSR